MTARQPAADDIRAVAAAISRAEIHDDRMTADHTRIQVWAEATCIHGVTDTATACQAVDAHYTRPGADTMRVGDLIANYRRLRALEGEEAKARELTSGGMATSGDPVWDAYEHYGAIDRECPTCGAGVRESCTNGVLTRRIPCAARQKRTGLGAA